MGQDPDSIRREIEQTRERMGETVDALGYKADVPSRTKEAVSGRVQSVKEAITGRATDAAGTVGGAAGSVNERTPSMGDIKQGARKGAGIAQENPLGLALGAIGIGFAAGLLLPATRVENEKIGPMADTLKEQARETGQEALERGRAIAQEVGQTAQEAAQQVTSEVKDTAQQAAGQVKETAQQSAHEHGSQLADSAQQSAQEVRQEASTPR